MKGKDIFCVIMAGGSGTVSGQGVETESLNNFFQLLKINTYQNTIDRFLTIIPEQNLYVISKNYKKRNI